MKPVTLRGITWDHRRAIDPLLNTVPMFQAQHPDIEIAWSSRPLSGFEFTPVMDWRENSISSFSITPSWGPLPRRSASCRWTRRPARTHSSSVIRWRPIALTVTSGPFPSMPPCQVAVSRPVLMRSLDMEPPLATGTASCGWANARGTRDNGLAIGLKGVHS